MMKLLKITLIFALIIAFVLFINTDVFSQCPMCRMSAESNLKSGGTAAKGLNNGILYIFALPYLLVSVIGYIWWKNNKKRKTIEESNVSVQ